MIRHILRILNDYKQAYARCSVVISCSSTVARCCAICSALAVASSRHNESDMTRGTHTIVIGHEVEEPVELDAISSERWHRNTSNRMNPLSASSIVNIVTLSLVFLANSSLLIRYGQHPAINAAHDPLPVGNDRCSTLNPKPNCNARTPRALSNKPCQIQRGIRA